MVISYPVSRLLAQPKVFNAISSSLGGFDADIIRSAFYDLLEINFNDLDQEDCEFDASEAVFEFEGEGEPFIIQLNNGISCQLRITFGEHGTQVNSDRDLAAASVVYQKLVSAIEESYPELTGDVALCSPPTPGNNFLTSENGDYFEGMFHLKSDPDSKYSFNVQVLDQDSEEMKASIKQI